MPPKKAKAAVALSDQGHVDGWRYIVNATTGIVQITGSVKRVPYKLTRNCAPTRAAQRAEILQHLRGRLVVRIQWYKLVQVSQRAYILVPEERVIPVNTIVRLLGLAFSNSAAAGTPAVSAERVTRSAAREAKLHFFDEDNHNLVEAACRHQGQEEAEAEERP